ncbi:MAG TPA: hypothetical protein VK023_08105 [Sphingobacterium bovisgrunnientis]|uniref:hypothetical protein n=1 Tax=Sphingobacterium bovisgrunnientis TaxID=1874697 RepID=UPI0013594C39|nr:hypothetical protein [Sphingobacterium bovisgrunnientis]HLS38221.1 hypothetical protein [Sphingobacterium bovisgrunnientis]
MSSDLTIEISPTNAEELAQNSQLIMSHLTEDSLQKIREYILDNLDSLDGGPSIMNLSVINLNYNSDTKKGSFRLKFQIDRQYCCSDLQACANDYLDFDFSTKDDKLVARAAYFDWSLTN